MLTEEVSVICCFEMTVIEAPKSPRFELRRVPIVVFWV